METTAIVVMEPGSDWPGQIGYSMNVVASCDGGEDMFRRTQEKLGALHGSKTGVRVAVLACNSATDGAALVRRAQVARALLGAVTFSTCGRLILGASERASHQLRQELLALAEALNDEVRGTTATVSLRFAESSHGKAFESTQREMPELRRVLLQDVTLRDRFTSAA